MTQDIFMCVCVCVCRFLWPRDRRRGSAAIRLMGMRVRKPPGNGYLSLVGGCCVLSGRGLCVGLITHPEES